MKREENDERERDGGGGSVWAMSDSCNERHLRVQADGANYEFTPVLSKAKIERYKIRIYEKKANLRRIQDY